MKINNNYYGFNLIEIEEIKDINSKAYIYEHEKTKAKLVYIQNDEENKTFAVSFKTPPEDETGLTHILEHSVLSGSTKYPVKSPFLELRKSSLSTFLNAMTFSDKTMYPVSSINDKDFKNLTDTYLDAVFNPLVLEKEEIFLQEGWRYEIDPQDQSLKYNGIVFNEMKGAYSSPDRGLINKISESLFPDTFYALDSGGNPDYITDLKYENFIEYHRKYYHPTNAYFFLYGKLNINEHLEYLNTNYLSKFDFKNEDYSIPFQEKFSTVKDVKGIYGISKDQKKSNKTYLSKNFVIGSILDKKEIIALRILEKIFFDVTGSELKKRLMNAEIAEEIDGFFFTSGQQPFFTFMARNSEEEHFQVFENIVYDYLKELVSEKIDEELLTGALNSIEFRLRENALSPNKGIAYAQTVMSTWLYDEGPTKFLSFSEEISQLREDMKNGYFEKVIKKAFLENKHASNVILLPEAGLEEKKNEEIIEKLNKIKAEMTKEELEKVISKNIKFKAYQEEEETSEKLECIPIIDIKDIKRTQEEIPFELEETEEGKYLLHPMFTNKIAYLDLYFTTARVPEDKIKFIYLLNDLLTGLSTKEYDYQKLAKMINTYTGGIDFSVMCVNRHISRDIYPFMKVSTKTFPQNLDTTLSLVIEIIKNTLFTDKKRLKEELIELKAIKENEFSEDSMGIAQIRLASYISVSGKYQEEGNMEYYFFLKEILENYEDKFEEITRDLEWVYKNIFATNNLTSSITNDANDIEKTKNTLKKHLKQLSASNSPQAKYNFLPENLQEGIGIPAKVQYVIKGGSYYEKGYSYKGSMKVAAKILNTDYLWNKLRVLGGAYGGFASISILGNILFSSYRDPNLTETLSVYDNSGEFFRNLKLNKRDLTKFIIGTIGDHDSPMSVSSKGRLSNLYYFQEISQSYLQKIREEILDTTLTDLHNVAPIIDAVTGDNIYCIIGNEEKINENKEIFKKIIKIN